MVHIYVALDWVKDARERRRMERACAAARWPVALRSQQFAEGENGVAAGGFAREEVLRYVRSSLTMSAELLRQGRVLAVFPEGFPAIEPGERRTRPDDVLLPFAPGFTSIVQLAQRGGAAPVPIVPAGLQYERRCERYAITLRLGEPILLDGSLSREQAVTWIETRVRLLSGLA